jgi:hypothetical protein
MSKTDCTVLIYAKWHMRVKAYKAASLWRSVEKSSRLQQRFPVWGSNTPFDSLLRGAAIDLRTMSRVLDGPHQQKTVTDKQKGGAYFGPAAFGSV